MFNNRKLPSVVHVYHHIPEPPCKTCGYVMNSGCHDSEWLLEHIIHTAKESAILLKRMPKQPKAKK